MRHSEAAQVITRTFTKVAGRTPTDAERNYCQAVGWLETFYGRGGQFAKLFADGKVNWGALETQKQGGACPPGTASGTDVGTVCFYVYGSDDEACEAFLTTLLTANRTPGKAPVQADMIAAMTGSPADVATAMKSHGYFGAPTDQYAAAIATSLKAISGPGGITDQGVRFATPDPPPGTPPQTPATPGAKPGATGFMSGLVARAKALPTAAKAGLGVGLAAALAAVVGKRVIR